MTMRFPFPKEMPGFQFQKRERMLWQEKLKI